MTDDELYIELSNCIGDYESQGVRLTKRGLKEYVKKTHALTCELPLKRQNQLIDRLMVTFFKW